METSLDPEPVDFDSYIKANKAVAELGIRATTAELRLQKATALVAKLTNIVKYADLHSGWFNLTPEEQLLANAIQNENWMVGQPGNPLDLDKPR